MFYSMTGSYAGWTIEELDVRTEDLGLTYPGY